MGSSEKDGKERNNMKKLNNNEQMMINGGRTYKCIGCSKKSTSFASIYSHCLTSGHFKKNKYLKACWDAGTECLKKGLRLYFK